MLASRLFIERIFSTFSGKFGVRYHFVPHSLQTVLHTSCGTAVLNAPNLAGVAADLDRMAQGFLAPGTDVTPIVPALEKIWADSLGQSMASFNFRTVTSKFNDLVYEYPIRIPERYSLVIRCAHASHVPALKDVHQTICIRAPRRSISLKEAVPC